MFPVRCYTCDAVIAQHWVAFSQAVKGGDRPNDALRMLGQDRMCCRRMFLGHVDLITEQREYPCVDVVLDESGTVLRRAVRQERTSSCD